MGYKFLEGQEVQVDFEFDDYKDRSVRMADEHIMHQGAANATPRLKDRSRSHYTTTLRSTATTKAVTADRKSVV